jgi:hypothetical protein
LVAAIAQKKTQKDRGREREGKRVRRVKDGRKVREGKERKRVEGGGKKFFM